MVDFSFIKEEVMEKMMDLSLTKEEAKEKKAFETHIRDYRFFMSKLSPRYHFLTDINLSYINLEDQGVIALANALKNTSPCLEVLELAGNNITYEAAPDISTCIATKRHLKNLNLSVNDLEDEGCFEIVKGMYDLKIEYIDMSYNKLRNGGALDLAYGVIDKESLKMLNLDGNKISVGEIEEIKVLFTDYPECLGSFDENVYEDFEEGYGENDDNVYEVYEEEDHGEDYEDVNDCPYEEDHGEDDEVRKMTNVEDSSDSEESEDCEDEFVSVFYFY